MRCRRVRESALFLHASTRNPLFSPFNLWLADARPLDFMWVSGRRLGVKRADQNHHKPFLRIEFIKQRVLRIPVGRQQIVLQPDQVQGLRLTVGRIARAAAKRSSKAPDSSHDVPYPK